MRARLVETRRDLHAHPELAYQETRTADRVAARLRGLGLEPETGVVETGVVARLGPGGGRTVLLRADMDALPVEEESDVPYRSTHPGRMHACGHDGHTAALLEVAARLAADPPARGSVVLCFQPAEEGAGGARRMIDGGLLEGVDAAFGVHLWNHLPVGQVGLVQGPMMAAVDKFELTIRGRGGHGAMPEQTRDALVAACHVVTALQTIVSRGVSPLDGCVVTVGSLRAGDGFNVIPEVAHLSGTCRSFSAEAHAMLPGRVREVAEGVAGALGCAAELTYERLCPPTVNEASGTRLMREVTAALLGAGGVVTEGLEARTMAGEDFAFFLERVPGCFALVGSRNEARGFREPHHSPRFDFDEDALPVAVRLLEETARRYLGA